MSDGAFRLPTSSKLSHATTLLDRLSTVAANTTETEGKASEQSSNSLLLAAADANTEITERLDTLPPGTTTTYTGYRLATEIESSFHYFIHLLFSA